MGYNIDRQGAVKPVAPDAQAQRKVEEAKRERADVQATMAKLQSDHAKLTEAVAQLNVSANQKRAEIRLLVQEADTLRQQNADKAKAEMAQAEKVLADAKQKVAEANAQAALVQVDILALNEAKAALEGQIATLSRGKETRSAILAEINQLQLEKDNLTNSVIDARAVLAKAKEEQAALIAEGTAREKRLSAATDSANAVLTNAVETQRAAEAKMAEAKGIEAKAKAILAEAEALKADYIRGAATLKEDQRVLVLEKEALQRNIAAFNKKVALAGK